RPSGARGAHEHGGTLGFTLGKVEPPSGATTGGTPERPKKVANVFRNISVSTLSFSYPWKKWTRGVSNYGMGPAESWGRLRPRDTAPPYAYVAYKREPPRRRSSKSHTRTRK